MGKDRPARASTSPCVGLLVEATRRSGHAWPVPAASSGIPPRGTASGRAQESRSPRHAMQVARRMPRRSAGRCPRSWRLAVLIGVAGTCNLAAGVRALARAVAGPARARRLVRHDHPAPVHPRRIGCAASGGRPCTCGCNVGAASADASTFLSPAVRSLPFSAQPSTAGHKASRGRECQEAFAFDGVLQCMRQATVSARSPK